MNKKQRVSHGSRNFRVTFVLFVLLRSCRIPGGTEMAKERTGAFKTRHAIYCCFRLNDERKQRDITRRLVVGSVQRIFVRERKCVSRERESECAYYSFGHPLSDAFLTLQLQTTRRVPFKSLPFLSQSLRQVFNFKFLARKTCPRFD